MEYRQELGLGTKLKTYLGTEAGAKMEDQMVSDEAVAKEGDFEDYCDVRLS